MRAADSYHPRPGLNQRITSPMASTLTTRPPRTTNACILANEVEAGGATAWFVAYIYVQVIMTKTFNMYCTLLISMYSQIDCVSFWTSCASTYESRLIRATNMTTVYLRRSKRRTFYPSTKQCVHSYVSSAKIWNKFSWLTDTLRRFLYQISTQLQVRRTAAATSPTQQWGV
jgi:hypothetical protein